MKIKTVFETLKPASTSSIISNSNIYLHDNCIVDSKNVVEQLIINKMKNEYEIHITYNK